jgi:hypothetical protein
MCRFFAHNLCALHAAFRALTVERAALWEGKSGVFIVEGMYSMDDTAAPQRARLYNMN